ncbi:MAG: ATP-binding protein [Candidatus Korobacteraceae bacterium]|jgi:serine/threonine-protein kinase RsbW
MKLLPRLLGTMDEHHAMTTTRVSYTLESTLESIHKAEQAAAELAAKTGFDAEECGRITIAVREATANAVLHGNHWDPNKHVTVSFESAPSALTVMVSDEGPGLDPALLPDPLAPENLLRQSGRGIFLIKSFMDEVRFRSISPGTELTMIKFVLAHGSSEEGNP